MENRPQNSISNPISSTINITFTYEDAIYKISFILKILSIITQSIDILCLIGGSLYTIISLKKNLKNEIYNIIEMCLFIFIYIFTIIYVHLRKKKLIIFILLIYIVCGIIHSVLIAMSIFGRSKITRHTIEYLIIIFGAIARWSCYFSLLLYVMYIIKQEEILEKKLNEDLVKKLGYSPKRVVKKEVVNYNSLISDPLFPGSEKLSNTVFNDQNIDNIYQKLSESHND